MDILGQMDQISEFTLEISVKQNKIYQVFLRNRIETHTVTPFGQPVNDMPISRHGPAQPTQQTNQLASQ